MAKLNSLLSERLKGSSDKSTKMGQMAELSAKGALSSFSGVFQVQPLDASDRQKIQELLANYQQEGSGKASDLDELLQLTSEVRAITAQAAILHGERIKKAQGILKDYADGAFSAWLIATYGNRQTPYNFLYYYELYQALPKTLHSKLDAMPRQVVYALAARQGELALKEALIAEFSNQTKQELLEKIRSTFPLKSSDRRNRKFSSSLLANLDRIQRSIEVLGMHAEPSEKKAIKQRLKQLIKTVENLS